MSTSVEDAGVALRIDRLSKSFGGRRVLSDVSFEVAAGEVHALLGQNGCGKSTLIKCLAGVHRPDVEGRIMVAGVTLPHAYEPDQSRSYGLAFVHQDLGLIPDMTVIENMALVTGFKRRGPLISWASQRRMTERVLEEFGIDVSPDSLIRDIPVTSRTLLAIARALHVDDDDAGRPMACLVLDEPTAALPDHDAEKMFSAIEQVTAKGVGVIYVTHRLEEIFRIAKRATILRDGRLISTVAVDGLTHQSLVSSIVGDVRSRARSASAGTAGPSSASRAQRRCVLEVDQLTGARIKSASFSVERGEIVGIAGLAGSGRSELTRLLFGAQKKLAGRVRINGQVANIVSPKDAMRYGIALVPEDRRRDGCVLPMSVAENLTLAKIAKTRRFTIDLPAERRAVADAITLFDIRPANMHEPILALSGGNQQKVVLAKWLARKPQLLILDEPVQGVDVGAKADIFATLHSVAASGTGLLVIDSDFENLAALCDRVLILSEGEIVEALQKDRLTSADISSATFGLVTTHDEL